MSAEPALSHASLLGALRADYGLPLGTLTFIPDGTAPAYRAGGEGGRYFVKVLPNTPSGREAARRIGVEVSLLRALREGGVLPRVPRPVPTRAGADLSRVEGYALAVFGWIEARNLSRDWEAALGDLAPLLGRLHAGAREITARVSRLPVPPEDFGLPFEAGLLADLERLRSLPSPTRPGVGALRDLVLPREAEVRRLLEQARAFQGAARARSRPFVVCHTDAHGGNVMRGPSGELWVIDWETARLAPPEHDLWMLGERLPEVLPAYEAAFGQRAHLDADVLGFYACRRVLEDLAFDVQVVLHENTRPEEDESHLAILEGYVLPALATTREDLERFGSLP